VIQLTWSDVKINGIITLATKVKGGEYVNREVSDPSVKTALLDYLESSGRLAEMMPGSPLWTAHDRTGQNTGKPLTSHGFVKNLKRYAQAAGLDDIHLHQTRHTFARVVSEETGSIVETQDALGHKNAATTRVYVQRIGVKKDKHSAKIAARFGL
jgi:integrase